MWQDVLKPASDALNILAFWSPQDTQQPEPHDEEQQDEHGDSGAGALPMPADAASRSKKFVQRTKQAVATAQEKVKHRQQIISQSNPLRTP